MTTTDTYNAQIFLFALAVCSLTSLKQDVTEVSSFQSVALHTNMVLSNPFHSTECVQDRKVLLLLTTLYFQSSRSIQSWSRTSVKSPPPSPWSFIPTRSCPTHSTVQNALEIAKPYSEVAFTTLCFCSRRPVQIAHSPPWGRMSVKSPSSSPWSFIPTRSCPTPSPIQTVLKSKVFKYAKWPSKWLTNESLVSDLMKFKKK